MRKDIYVVQKTKEEGEHLKDWCIINGIPVDSTYFGFTEGNTSFLDDWNCFGYRKHTGSFCKNYERKDVIGTEVTIEEFKRLQLESLDKTEPKFKIGNWVKIKDEEFDSLGEGDNFNDKKGVVLFIEEISNSCVTKLSGIKCSLSFNRFVKCDPLNSDLKPGDYITVTDENINDQFKMIGKVTEVRSDKDETNIRGKADFIAVNKKEFNLNSLWCYKDNRKRKYRKSTEEEIQWLNECIKQNKFVELSEVSQFKPEFIVGRWYKSNKNSSKDYYIKIKNVVNENHIEGDCIRTLDNKKYQENSYWDAVESILDALQRGPLTDLSEIQEYLPENHEDKQIQTNDKWLIEQAKRLYPIGTKIYQLYAGGTSNKSHEITIQNHDFTIDSDGEVLYNVQYRVYTPINDTWATKVEEKQKYEVVHCKTQEEWDFVKSKIPSNYAMSREPFHEDCAICISEKSYAELIWWQQQNAKILSFEEWCNMNGHNFELVKAKIVQETKYKVGDVVIATGNISGYERLKGRIKEIKLDNVKGHQYRINYREFNSNKYDAIWSDVHELVENESLVGRWVKRISYNVYSSFKNPKIGGYDLIESDKGKTWFLKTFMNCEKEHLLKDFELIPEGFDPNKIIEPSLDFGSLNLKDWLRETKKLNLSQEELEHHIGSSYTCNLNVFQLLKGYYSSEKAEILWNEWNNKVGIVQEPIIVSIPDEWRQNKYVIGIDPYKLIKPNTQSYKATLIPVKQKQIFKN